MVPWADWAVMVMSAALGLMGAYLTVKPLQETNPRFALERLVWLLGFGLLVTLTVLLTAYNLGKPRLEDEERHGAYCFFLAYQPDGVWIPGPKWPLRMENPNTFPIDDVTARMRQAPIPQDTEEEIQRKIGNVTKIDLGTVRPDGDFTDVSIAPGVYQFDIYTRYERFTQKLIISPDPKHTGGWRTDYEVRRFPKGELLRKCCAD
jgi:hypothetical protein